jgi:hypothetical protein
MKALAVFVGTLVVLGFVSVAPVSAAAAKAAAQKPGIGTWAFTTVSPEGTTTSTLVISEDGAKLKAVARSERGERPYDAVEVAGTNIKLVLTINYNGSPMVITYTGTIDSDKMGGDADFGGLATGSWSATAQKP